MKVIRHMSVNLEWLARMPKKKLAKTFKDENGKYYTSEEALELIFEFIREGKERIPLGRCDNFDFKKGCQGHKP